MVFGNHKFYQILIKSNQPYDVTKIFLQKIEDQGVKDETYLNSQSSKLQSS